MLEEMKPLCGLSLEHNPQVGFGWQQGGGRLERNSSTQVLICGQCTLQAAASPSRATQTYIYECVHAWVLTWHTWHDQASAPCHHLTESESELSVSGFLSVASHSCEEDEGRDAPLLSSLRHPNALGGPTGMSGEGDHGNQPDQYNGVKKHRWDMLQLWCHACLLA